MSQRRVLGWLLIVGCGDEPSATSAPPEPPPPVFAAVCGTEGPHPLLSLSPGEHAYRLDPAPSDERVLLSTFLVDPQIPLAQHPPSLDRAIYAVGPCGEDPVELARGLSLGDRHGDLLIACRENEPGAFALDPEGARRPRALVDGWCPLRSTDAGLLTVQTEPGARHGTLVLLRDPADPRATPEVLGTDIRDSRNRYFGPGRSDGTSLWARGLEAVALDRAGVVHRFDLSTGASVEELTGVREFRISSDGRWMIWQTLEPAEGDPEAPVGPVFLRDRAAQTDAHLLNTHLEWTRSPFGGELLVIRDDVEGLQVFRREGPEPIALPAGTDYRGRLDDGALWLARRVDGLLEELRWTPGGGPPTLIVRHAGQVARRSDGLEIFEDDERSPPNEGRLEFVPWTGGEPVTVADHVHASRRRLHDGRVMTIVREDERGHGSLRLIDPETGGWTELDPHGYVQSPRLNAGAPFDGDVVYAVADPDTDRRGVYRARVASP